MLEQIIMSVGPPRPYIHTTLKSINTDLPITLVMDSDVDFLPEYNFKKILRDSPVDPIPRIQAGKNYIRCLQLAEGKNTLIVEDDVEFRPNWIEEMTMYVDYVEIVYKKYVLSIAQHGYHIDGWALGPQQIDFGLVREPVQRQLEDGKWHILANTNARYFPATMAEHIKQIMDGIKIAENNTYDLTLDLYLAMSGVKLFISQRPLVTHIGRESGIGNAINRWDDDG